MFDIDKFVEWMNQTNGWKGLEKKQAHDDKGNPVEGKYFLSTGGKLRKQAVTITIDGEQFHTSQLEIPTIIARNIQAGEAPKRSQTGRILTQAAKIDPATLSAEDKAKARELLARLAE